MTHLNYTPLTTPVTAQEIRDFKKYHKTTKMWVYVLCFMFLVMIPTVLYLLDYSFVTVLFAVVITAPYMILLGLAERQSIKKIIRLRKLSAANNLKFFHDELDPLHCKPRLLIKDSLFLDEGLIFQDGTLIGNSTVDTKIGGVNKSYKRSIALVKLNRKLPNMLLDSKRNNVVRMVSSLPNSLQDCQILSLEGDFDKHFRLYVPKGYERDALYVFTPDVMAALIDEAGDYDAEIIDDNFIIYRKTPMQLQSQKDLNKMLTIASNVQAELVGQSKRYSDFRVDQHPKEGFTIHEKGRRLKINNRWKAILFVGIFLVYMSGFIAFVFTYI